MSKTYKKSPCFYEIFNKDLLSDFHLKVTRISLSSIKSLDDSKKHKERSFKNEPSVKVEKLRFWQESKQCKHKSTCLKAMCFKLKVTLKPNYKREKSLKLIFNPFFSPIIISFCEFILCVISINVKHHETLLFFFY